MAITVKINEENSFIFYAVALSSSDIIPFTHQSYVGYTNFVGRFSASDILKNEIYYSFLCC